MSRIFEERERGYEAKWAHDQETHFKVLARRDYLAGHWAAALMKLSSSQADEYASEMRGVGMLGKGRDPVFEKIRDDFKSKGIDCSDRIIHRKMEEFFTVATNEVVAPIQK